MSVLFVVGIILCSWAGLALIFQVGGTEWRDSEGIWKSEHTEPWSWYAERAWRTVINTFLEMTDWTETRLKAAIFWVGLAGLILLLI